MMTRDEIMKLEAGRKLDILIGTEVMGWAYVEMPRGYNDYWESEQLSALLEKEMFESSSPRYISFSSDIRAAWLVLFVLRSKYRISIDAIGSDSWQCDLEIMDGIPRFPVDTPHAGDVYAQADTAPLAICRAALEAVIGTEG